MAKIIWSERAINNLESIAEYIEEDSPENSSKFVRSIIGKVENLSLFPEMGRIVPEIEDTPLRELIIGSYRIIYKAGLKSVEIVTIHHSARILKI